jgi:hypothetical protein
MSSASGAVTDNPGTLNESPRLSSISSEQHRRGRKRCEHPHDSAIVSM